MDSASWESPNAPAKATYRLTSKAETQQGKGRQGAWQSSISARLQLLGHALAGRAVEVLRLLPDRAGQLVGSGAGLARPLRRVVAIGGRRAAALRRRRRRPTLALCRVFPAVRSSCGLDAGPLCARRSTICGSCRSSCEGLCWRCPLGALAGGRRASGLSRAALRAALAWKWPRPAAGLLRICGITPTKSDWHSYKAGIASACSEQAT